MLVVLLQMNRGARGDFASELRATAKPMTTPNYPCSLAVLGAAKSGDEVVRPCIVTCVLVLVYYVYPGP